jgi:hypothetical protein
MWRKNCLRLGDRSTGNPTPRTSAEGNPAIDDADECRMPHFQQLARQNKKLLAKPFPNKDIPR